jgi:hypothetical protein
MDQRLAQLREYAARSPGGSPAAAPSSRQVLIRSLKEPRPDGWTIGCDGGASICGTTGTSIFGGGNGGGGGGLNCDAPGCSICADATFAATSGKTTQRQNVTIDIRRMSGMS